MGKGAKPWHLPQVLRFHRYTAKFHLKCTSNKLFARLGSLLDIPGLAHATAFGRVSASTRAAFYSLKQIHTAAKRFRGTARRAIERRAVAKQAALLAKARASHGHGGVRSQGVSSDSSVRRSAQIQLQARRIAKRSSNVMTKVSSSGLSRMAECCPCTCIQSSGQSCQGGSSQM